MYLLLTNSLLYFTYSFSAHYLFTANHSYSKEQFSSWTCNLQILYIWRSQENALEYVGDLQEYKGVWLSQSLSVSVSCLSFPVSLHVCLYLCHSLSAWVYVCYLALLSVDDKYQQENLSATIISVPHHMHNPLISSFTSSSLLFLQSIHSLLCMCSNNRPLILFFRVCIYLGEFHTLSMFHYFWNEKYPPCIILHSLVRFLFFIDLGTFLLILMFRTRACPTFH